jgi:hypothetical protein
MTAQDVLEKVAAGMVAVGLYKDVETAIRALALEQIERKIAAYQTQVQGFEGKYDRSLEEQSRFLEGKATMEEEEEWMEWKGAVVMLEAWQKALQEVLRSASSAGH